MRVEPLYQHLARSFLAAVCVSIACSASAATPSFLCSKAKTWVEKTICASAKLSEQDLELALIYSHMLRVLSGDAQKAFNAEQRTWWANRAQCQKDKDPPSCLERRYDGRIAELTSRPDYPGDQPRAREEFTEALIKEAGQGWSQSMSTYMKAIRSCVARASPKPRAVLTAWSEEGGDLIAMRLRGPGDEELVCIAKKDGTQANVRPREPAETLPEAGPILWLGSGAIPKEACGKPIQVLDTDDTPVGWMADANC